MQGYFMALLYNLTLLSNRTKGNKNGLFKMYVAKKKNETNANTSKGSWHFFILVKNTEWHRRQRIWQPRLCCLFHKSSREGLNEK